MGRERNDSFMKRPVLVIMAAGMGSRYGGLKQIDPIDREGHIIIDFSIYDARRAGFEKVVFIIMDIMRFLLFIIFLQHMKIQKNIHIQWWDIV